MTDGSSPPPVPALAVIDPAGMVQQSTEEFARRCNGAAELIEHDPQIDQVLAGQLDHARLTVGEVEFEVEAVSSTDGVRHALLTALGGDSVSRDPQPLLSQRFDDSPALIWCKDLDGRYLMVNRRYTEVLETSEDRLLGRTDRELPPREVVDGPRLLESTAPVREPLQLEYTIGSFEDRPALAVLRFAIRDSEGEPVAVCGVAAPLADASVARSECARLMRLERWARLDPGTVRNELLEEWGLVAEPPESEVNEPPVEPTRAEPPERPAEPEIHAYSEPEPPLEPEAALEPEAPRPNDGELVAQRDAAIAERDEAIARHDELVEQTAELQRELGEGRRRIAALHEASATAARRAHELMSELTQERDRRAEIEAALEQARTEGAPVQPPSSSEDLERAELAESELASARQHIARLEGELEQLQTKLAQESARVQEAERRLQRERELAEAARPARAALQEAQAEAKQAQFELHNAHASLQRARADTQSAQEALHGARADAADAQEALERERSTARSLQDALAGARSDTAAAQADAEQGRSESAALREQLVQIESELAAARDAAVEAAAVAPAPPEPEPAPPREEQPSSPLRWTPLAQRRFSATITGSSEWRTGLKDAIKVLGTEGGWDAVTAWAPAERATLRCIAMWTREADRRGRFETLTWQRPESLAGTELGHAAGLAHAVTIERIHESDDHRLAFAAAEGMRCGMLVPIRDGVSMICLLELLSREEHVPEGDLATSLEAISLQLAQFAHLLRLGARPHWSLGRL